MNKKDRQQKLQQILDASPLLTDEKLSDLLNVSVQTIRLDRAELGVPEMRERARSLAQTATGKLKAMANSEFVGELIDLNPGDSGISLLEATSDMAFARTGVVRGHHIFAQANSLAVAVTDAETALTGRVRVKFLRPVFVGDRIVAKAHVTGRKGKKYLVDVSSTVDSREVSNCRFVIAIVADATVSGGEGRSRM